MLLEEGGWAQETTVRELPTSTELAFVNMRLDYGAYRELRWHTEAERAYVLGGSCRITVLGTEGGCSNDDLQKGNLW
jgi:oxalate decarboxylase/phosphoglucose isomerase-like protein (cupin superfamily)